jgi:hypothetical protein
MGLRARLWLAAGVAVVGAPLALGCNVFTGADDLVIDEDAEGANGKNGAGPSGNGSGPSGNGAGAGGGGASSGAGASVPGPSVPAAGVRIESLALYQGVKRVLAVGGAEASSNVPIVAGRPALVRVFYGLDAAYDGQPVTARMLIGGSIAAEATATLSGTSTDGDPQSTLNLALGAEAMSGGASYRVELVQPAPAGGDPAAPSPEASFPAQGEATLPASPVGALAITLVPVAYHADGSGRLPDTSDAQIERYRSTLFKLYPAAAVDVQVRAPYPWQGAIQPNGQGWGSVLNAILELRQQDGAAPGRYYYGIFAPASSFASYCSGGCVAGLSTLAGPTDVWGRGGVGVGFTGQSSADTAAHEIGHMHGRGHAPCGAFNGIDPSYPYNGGGIGTWGYDLIDAELVSPTSTRDIMSYCNPAWVSDYTYAALFQRMQLVGGAKLYAPGGPKSYERIAVGPDGAASWLAPLTLALPPLGAPTTVEAVVDGAPTKLTGHFFGYSHLPGGILLLAPPLAGTLSVASFPYAGQMLSVSR